MKEGTRSVRMGRGVGEENEHTDGQKGDSGYGYNHCYYDDADADADGDAAVAGHP